MSENKLFPYRIGSVPENGGVEFVECSGAIMAHILQLSKVVDKEMKHPAKWGQFIALLCARGEVSFSSHLTDYSLTENSLFIAPSALLQFKSCTEDCEVYIVTFNEQFAADMHIDFRVVLPVLSSLRNNNVVLTLPADTVDNIKHKFLQLHSEYLSNSELSPTVAFYRAQALRHIYAAFIFSLCEVVVNRASVQRPIAVKDRTSEYFERLLRLLEEHYKTERSVEFYADKMNLTPKHLSRVVRNFSGKSVHQWIDDFVVLEIKNLLKHSDMSIQQISYELHFPNPSFMGQYFKRITGKTPGEYRREI
jgi:AraC-like DNA-binding protein